MEPENAPLSEQPFVSQTTTPKVSRFKRFTRILLALFVIGLIAFVYFKFFFVFGEGVKTGHQLCS